MAAVSVEALVDRGMQTQLQRLREAQTRGVPRIGWKLGNGKAVRQPEPSLVPQNLGALVLAVADCLARYDEALSAGDRIISGSFVKPMIAEPGDVVKVDFGVLGRVELSIASRDAYR